MKKTYIFALSLLLPCVTMAMLRKTKSLFPIRKTEKHLLERSKSFQMRKKEPRGDKRWCFCRKNPEGQSIIEFVKDTQNVFGVVRNVLKITLSKSGDCTAIVTPSPHMLPLSNSLKNKKGTKILLKLLGYDKDAREAVKRAWESSHDPSWSGKGKIVYVKEGMAKEKTWLKRNFGKEALRNFPQIRSIEIKI